jgi:acyl-CoA hydrolase
MAADYWADGYVDKKRTGADAVRVIRPGQRVFIGSSCGEPRHLLRELFLLTRSIADVEIVRLFCLESSPFTLIADQTQDQIINIRSFYMGSSATDGLIKQTRFITPVNLYEVPHLFTSRKLPIHVALIQVSPPDDFGWMSLGISVDVTLAAAQSADLVVAQVNSNMPRVFGRGFIHVNDVDIVVEHDEKLLTSALPPPSVTAEKIGQNIRTLIDDGATVHIGLGPATQAAAAALSGKNDLGVHTQHLTDEIMRLVSIGIVTNLKKGYNVGKLVAGGAIGSDHLYEFMDDNPSIELHPSDYVNDPSIISRHRRMVSITDATVIDLTGQVAADALPHNHFAGITGMTDFMRGAVRSNGGKSILVLPSTFAGGKGSRIVSRLNDRVVVVPRGDVHYVATEFGVVNLFGKNIQERALAMISIANPEVRDTLVHEARKSGLICPDRGLHGFIHGVYPLDLEEQLNIDGSAVLIRPVKPADVRRIQEHYYNLDDEDVYSRFFHRRKNFFNTDVEGIAQIDYIRQLTMVAVVGEPGFERVIGMGEYALLEKDNTAEVSFSVSKAFQGKGIGRLLIKKMAQAAAKNGIECLTAYVSFNNKKMVKLFHCLPHRIRASKEEGVLVMTCQLDEPN